MVTTGKQWGNQTKQSGGEANAPRKKGLKTQPIGKIRMEVKNGKVTRRRGSAKKGRRGENTTKEER